MKTNLRRALALCLALVLALSLMAVSAGAAGDAPFTLQISDNGDGTLTVSLVCAEAISAFGAADGVMDYDSARFTLQSIEAGALQDMTPNVAQARFAASAKDYTNGDSMEAGAEWVRYVFQLADTIPDGKYTFTLTLTNGVDVNFTKYAWSGASVSESWRKGEGSFALEAEADGADKLLVKLIGLQDVSDFGAADAVIDWNDHTHLTLQSIEGVALKDLTANVETGRFGASAEDYANGDRMAAGEVWAQYTFLVDENTPSGTYTFTLTFENGVNIGFQDYSWKDDTITDSYTLEASPAVNLAAVAAAKAAIEDADWTVEQATANTESAVKAWVETQIANLDLGTVETAVSITAITPAAAGTASAPDGTEGSFAFTVALTLNEASDTAAVTNGKITPTPFTPKLTYQEALEKTLNYIQTADPAPTGGSSDWTMLALARSGIALTKDYVESYAASAAQFIQEQIAAANDGEKLHKNKSSENSRMILALTALGIDPRDVEGHDLTAALSDLSYLQKQGFNGPIWALIALDSHEYDVAPLTGSGPQATREALIGLILSKQLSDGGWALSGSEGDSDITAMTIQALAPYYETDAEVKAAVDRAVACLSEMQRPDGHFEAHGNSGKYVNAESTAQVLVALSALGIDADTDPRFVKGGVSALDALLSFFVEDGGFEHIRGEGRDGMATEQGAYALVAYDRFRNGKTALYDMSDVTFEESSDDQLVTVRFHLLGGTAAGITDGAEKTYARSEDGARLPTPTKDGYTFDGWYSAETGGTKYETVAASLPGDLYARWTESSSGGSGEGDDSSSDEMTVYFTLLGAPDDGEFGTVHTLIDDNLELWYSATKTFEAKSMTAEEVFRAIMDEAGIEWKGSSKNQYNSLYVSGVKSPLTGEWMEEFTTTPNSGWMYTVNGVHPNVGLSSFTLYDGDEFVVHFTDDYTKEEDAAQYKDDSDSEDSGTIRKADGDSVTLTAQEVAEAAEAGEALTVETDNGDVILSPEALEALAAEEKDVTVSIVTNDDGSKTVDVTVEGESADVTVKVALPAPGNAQVLVLINADGSETIVKKSIVENGRVYADLPAGARVKTAANKKTFTDVKDSDWFASAVDFASSHELFRGVSEAEFAPRMPMTRAMLVTVLYRLEGEPKTTAGIRFDDVSGDAWYADAVAWASANQIVNGTGSGFAPNDNVTREQIATILYRYMKYLGVDVSAKGDLSKFGDGKDVSSWAQDAMLWAVKVGLFRGDDANRLNPGSNATRAEVATLMQRLVRLIVM